MKRLDVQNDTLRIVGSVKEQRPHGYIIEIPARPPADGAKDVFVLTDARAAVGDSVDWTVYFIGEYDYPTNDTGDSVRIAKTTDKIGVAADYVLKKGISDVSSELSMYR